MGRPIILLSCLWIGACDAGPNASSSDDLPVVRGAIDLEIGDMAGDDPYLFSSISGITSDLSGRIYAVDFQSDEIRVFDSEGVYQGAIGGSGEGPGELGQPCCVALDPEGRLWVRDVANARYSAFDLVPEPPEFMLSIPVGHAGAGLWASTTFDRAGRLVDVGPSGGPHDARVRYHTTLDGVVESTTTIPIPPPEAIGMHAVERQVEGGVATYFVYQPFGPRHLLAHGVGGRWAESISSEYVVTLHTPEGAAVTIHKTGVIGVELDEDDRVAGEAAMAQDRERLGISRLPYGLPARKTPLRDLFFGTDGRLWVELNAPGEMRAADVYDDSGHIVGRFEWPAAVRVGIFGWAGASSLIGVTRDSLGVERIARVRFP